MSDAAAPGAANRINMPKPKPKGDAANRAVKAKAASPAGPVGEAAAPPPAPPSRWKSLISYAVPLLFMPTGYFFSSVLFGTTKDTGEHVAERPVDPHLLDDAIEDSDFEAALKEIRGAAKSTSPDVRQSLKFREAICLEGLEKYSDAAEAYAGIADASERTIRGGAARLGQARCWMRMGRVTDARRLLAYLTLTSEDFAELDQNFIVEILYTKADLELAATPKMPKAHPFRPDGVAASAHMPDIVKQLAWAGHLPVPTHAEHGHDDAHGAKSSHGKTAADHHAPGPAEPAKGAAKHDSHGPSANKADAHDTHKPSHKDDAHAPDHDSHKEPTKKADPKHDAHAPDHDPHKEPSKKTEPKKDGHDDHHAPVKSKDAEHKEIGPKPHEPEHGPAPKETPSKKAPADDHPPAKGHEIAYLDESPTHAKEPHKSDEHAAPAVAKPEPKKEDHAPKVSGIL